MIVDSITARHVLVPAANAVIVRLRSACFDPAWKRPLPPLALRTAMRRIIRPPLGSSMRLPDDTVPEALAAADGKCLHPSCQ